MNELRQLESSLCSILWFVPMLIIALSIALAVALIAADSAGNKQWLARWPYLFGANVAGYQ